MKPVRKRPQAPQVVDEGMNVITNAYAFHSRVRGELQDVDPWWSKHAPALAESFLPYATDNPDAQKLHRQRYLAREEERTRWLIRNGCLEGAALREAEIHIDRIRAQR